MKYSLELKDLAAALCKAQAALRGALKDSHNPHLRTWYADLNSCWNALRGPLTDNGLTVVQPFATDNGRVIVTTVLMHVSGQWMSMEAGLTPKSGAPADLGTVVSYLRRYSLCAMTGLSSADDEDEDTSTAPPEQPAPAMAPAGASSIASPELLQGEAMTKFQSQAVASFFRQITQILNDPDAPDDMRASALLAVRDEMNEDKVVFTQVWRKLAKAEQSDFRKLIERAEAAITGEDKGPRK